MYRVVGVHRNVHFRNFFGIGCGGGKEGGRTQ